MQQPEPNSNTSNVPFAMYSPGADPVLKRLQTPPDEAALQARAAEHAVRLRIRERRYKHRVVGRTSIVMLCSSLAVIALMAMRPADWRDAALLPIVFAAMTLCVIWRSWHWLLALPLLALGPTIVLLICGGTVPYWFLKAPVLGGLGLATALATPWPTAED